MQDLLNTPQSILYDNYCSFYDLPKTVTCTHPEHTPPTMLYIPQGKGYRHVCPSCGKVTNLVPPQISF